jgi:glycosyltransferase involved in cell wall biosynthesis
MNSQTIWCISKYALPKRYGAQSRLFHISEEFNALGHQSIVITSAYSHLAELPLQTIKYRKSIEDNSETYFLKGIRIKKSISSSRVLSWFIFEYRLFSFIQNITTLQVQSPDVIIVSSLSLLTILNGIYAKKKFKCKLIFEIRDLWPMTAILVAGYSPYHPFILFLKWVEKFGYSKADVITSTLENANEHIENVLAHKNFTFKYIPQGFDFEYLKEDKLETEFIEKYIPNNKFIYGYIGNIVSAYDLDTMILCARQLQTLNNKIHFLILGDGEYKIPLINASADVSNITFIPRIPKAKVQHFLSYCHVVTNFLRPEPLFKFGVSPQKLVDYMLAGKPIIMSYTGYKTIVDEANCGSVVEAGNVTKLVDTFIRYSNYSKENLEEIGQNGKNYLLNNLSWKKIAQQYQTLFQ